MLLCFHPAAESHQSMMTARILTIGFGRVETIAGVRAKTLGWWQCPHRSQFSSPQRRHFRQAQPSRRWQHAPLQPSPFLATHFLTSLCLVHGSLRTLHSTLPRSPQGTLTFSSTPPLHPSPLLLPPFFLPARSQRSRLPDQPPLSLTPPSKSPLVSRPGR